MKRPGDRSQRSPGQVSFGEPVNVASNPNARSGAAQEQPDEKWFWTHACDKWAEIDPADLAPRRWIYGGHYLEGAVSATIADGGVGKSTLTLTEAIAIVTGRALLGITPTKQFYDGQEETRGVLYYNA